MKKIKVPLKQVKYTSLYSALQNCTFYYSCNEIPLIEGYKKVFEHPIKPHVCENCGFFVSPIGKSVYTKGGVSITNICSNCGCNNRTGC